MDRVPAKRILCSCATAMSAGCIVHIYRSPDTCDMKMINEQADEMHAVFTSMATVNDRRDFLVIRAFKPTIANYSPCDIHDLPPKLYDACFNLLINNWPAKPHEMNILTRKYGLINLKFKQDCGF